MVLQYVVTNLGRGVPPHACFSSTVKSLREDAVRSLVTEQWRVNRARNNPQQLWRALRRQRERLEDQLTSLLLEIQERKLIDLLFQQSSLNVLLNKLTTEPPSYHQKQLTSDNPLVRLLTVSAIGRRHLHLETELIERLNDPNPAVREAARKALIRVTRGTDLGPMRGTSRQGIERSIAQWRNWLALQQTTSPGPDKGTVLAAKPSKADPIEPVRLLLAQDSRELTTQRPEVTRLCDELLRAKRDEQRSLLARWRDGSAPEQTDALALAIPKLPETLRAEAEEILTELLRHLPTATLRDKLQDDNVEVRRAAAFACGRKLARELIPDLVQLLQDPEKDVIQAARAALTELSGEDFGPSPEANARVHAEAVAAWQKWCKEHTSAPR